METILVSWEQTLTGLGLSGLVAVFAGMMAVFVVVIICKTMKKVCRDVDEERDDDIPPSLIAFYGGSYEAMMVVMAVMAALARYFFPDWLMTQAALFMIFVILFLGACSHLSWMAGDFEVPLRFLRRLKIVYYLQVVLRRVGAVTL
ncbi:MAG: hypothetical protein Q8R12_00725 [bacterium]|nr:hypothetical protein [bacterium]